VILTNPRSRRSFHACPTPRLEKRRQGQTMGVEVTEGRAHLLVHPPDLDQQTIMVRVHYCPYCGADLKEEWKNRKRRS